MFHKLVNRLQHGNRVPLPAKEPLFVLHIEFPDLGIAEILSVALQVLFAHLSSVDEVRLCAFHVNIVFQSYNLIKYMTAVENVEVASDFDNRKVDPNKYLEKVGITEEEGRRLVGKLSGGQQQRVAIARALASNSPIIMADEPTGNLDEDTEAKIIDIFRDLAHKDHKIVIIVTHSRRVADRADKVLALRRGKLS